MGYGQHVILDVYTIGRARKVACLYDSDIEQIGAAHNIHRTWEMNGWKEISFSLPIEVNGESNWRAQFITNEYEIRLTDGDEIDWYRITEPTESSDGIHAEYDVVCPHASVVLRKRNISQAFDDSNGIGTLELLATRALDGSGWSIGQIDNFYETDSVIEKVRSYSCSEGTGAYTMIQDLCDKFTAYPVFHGDTYTVDLLNRANHIGMLEMRLEKNLVKLARKLDSSDIITRLYVKGEYGDLGYVGIDDVNPTGLNFLLNFDYYREIGALTAEQEAAILEYVRVVAGYKGDIESDTARNETNITTLAQNWGVQGYVIYPVSSGSAYGTPIYGNGTTAEDAMEIGDTVASVDVNGSYYYRTLTNLMPVADERWAIKFLTPIAGTQGSKEDAVTVKQQTVATLQTKYAEATTDREKESLLAQITATQNEITAIQTDQYLLMLACVNLALAISSLSNAIAATQRDMNDAEQTFAEIMGDLLQDGSYEDHSYAPGQEEALYNDSVSLLNVLSRPQQTYTFSEIDLANTPGYTDEIFGMNMQAHFYNETLGINDYGFSSKLEEDLDVPNSRKVEVQTDILNIQGKSFTALLSRITDVAQVIKDKQTIFERARAIGADGTFGTDKLNGIMDVLQNKLMSSSSNWYTDERGNIVFESADGQSAMMLSGSGFMVASGKTEFGTWNWRTFGTGEGFTADQMIAGVLQAGLITILGSEQFYWTGENLYVKDPLNDNKQIRIGKYNGTDLGIGYTTDGGLTWQTAIGFDGIHLSAADRIQLDANTASIELMPGRIEAAVSSVEVGAENLMTGTQYFNGNDWERMENWEEYSNEYAGCKVLRKNTAYNPPEQKIYVYAGEQYTFSAWLSGQTGSTINIQGHINRTGTTDYCRIQENSPVMTATLTTEWKRYSFTVTVTQSGWAEPRFEAYVPEGASQTTGYWYLCGLKFERGNKATDWSPAASELYAGSTVRMNEHEVWFSTPRFGIDINGGVDDETNERFQLDTNGGSFNRLTVNALYGDNNVARTYRGPGLIVIGGDDGTYQSLSEAMRELNGKTLLYNVTIRLDKDCTENVIFAGIHGGYSLGINGNNHTLRGSLAFNWNTAQVIVVDLTVSGGQTTVSGGSYADFARDKFYGWGHTGNNAQTYGILIEKGARVRLMNCEFKDAVNLICASELSDVWINGASGGNCTYFLWNYASTVRMTASRPSGGYRYDYEPITMPADPTTLTINTGTADPSDPPAPVSHEISLTANMSGTYGNGWMSNTNDIIQGKYGDINYKGCMWFSNPIPQGDRSSITVSEACLTLSRIGGSGKSGDITLTLYTIALDRKSGNPSTDGAHWELGTIGNGQTKDFYIPQAAQAFILGTATGFMLYAESEELISGKQYSTNYGRIAGVDGNAPVLKVTY